MGKIVLAGDVHLSDRPPSSCTETYNEDLLDLLRAVGRLALEINADAVIQAGDMFHNKTPSRNSHKLVLSAMDVLDESIPCPFFIVPGNHDMLNDRFESLAASQPLGVLLKSYSAWLLSGWSDVPSYRGKAVDYSLAPSHYWVNKGLREAPETPCVYGIPWLQTWNNADRSVADQGVEESLANFKSRWDGTVPALIVTHAPFYQPGTELEFEYYPIEDFARIATDGEDLPLTVYYGHVHEPHGVYRASNGVKFVNAGALSRGSLHEYNLTREIQVSVWDSATGFIEMHTLPHKPASEVFRLQEVQEVKSAQIQLDSFLSSIGEATIEVTSIESVVNHVRGLGLEDSLVGTIEELLLEAGK